MINKISTGSLDIDKWLEGGYDKDIITTIYGPAGCGKTNFCMVAAVNCAKKGGKVIFIDTEGGFSAERLKQLSAKKEDNEKALANLLILKPTSFDEQWDSFGRLLRELKSRSVDLIIVDGITMLYRLELAEAREDRNKVQETNSVLARQMRMLAEIARKKNIPVVITNQVYSDFLTDEEFREGKEKRVNMVGGDILKYWSKCLIELTNEKGRRAALLRKHRSLSSREIYFEIFDAGIKKKGWL